jgi:hypothetical protein
MLAVLLPLAAQASDVTAGAVLTLVIPLGLTLIALSVWWYVAARNRMTSTREPAETEPSAGSSGE